MKITASAYLVQGFYFQQRQLFRLGMKPGVGEAVVVDSALCRSMFSGVVWREDDWDEWQGFLSDPAGVSTLSSIELAPNKFSFEKQYEHRDDSIRYLFAAADTDQFWTGGYYGDAVGAGYANCIVTPLFDGMLQPPRDQPRD